ncbi:MAG: riboflavin biosynthesis protein RibF, partial [Saprospiraceae bacterium]|nr:riboflavin biosynthesis protein RibF [Saprospiraceae bacterium]
LLEQYGVGRVLCLRFGSALAEMEAEDFISAIIVKGLAVRHLVVGDDFRFGHGRRGDFAMLEHSGKRAGFDVENTHTYIYNNVRVSSTRIRDALAAGHLEEAAHLLDRTYAISGKVAHGKKRGREWGFPTANLPLGKRRPPLTGIFTVSVKGLGSAPVPGVASVGTRPVVNGRDTILEVHLLDFDQEIYGKRISVEFLRKQREEADFPSVAALIAQISRDKREAERFFAAAAR